MHVTVPTALTLGRLIATPAIPLTFLVFATPLADWIALLLFIAAAVTDWFDGHLARSWGQETKLGAMLDPIADKAIVTITIATLFALFGTWWLFVLPATAILFREIFVSGLREFLGDTAGLLKVTKLAKWKTTLQMVALGVLLGHRIIPPISDLVMWLGLGLIWVAGALTVVTGIDYFLKARPYLKEPD